MKSNKNSIRLYGLILEEENVMDNYDNNDNAGVNVADERRRTM